MAVFNYKIADEFGKIKKLGVEADSEKDATIKLRESGFVVLKYLGMGNQKPTFQDKFALFLRRDKFDICDFTGKLVPLLQAHVPLAKALSIVYDGSSNEQERAIVSSLRRGLQEGKKFSNILREHSDKFPVLYSSLIEAGEASGELTMVMKEIHKFLTDTKELKEFLTTSSIYPLVLLSVTFLVVVIIFLFFLPYFADIFVEMGKELPSSTQVMLSISNIVIHYYWVWILLLITSIIIIKKQWLSTTGRLKIERMILATPVVGKLVEAIQISRFFRTLAILFQGNVNLLSSIRIAVSVVNNQVISDSFSSMPTELRNGSRLSESLQKSNFISAEAIQMLKVGEESGEVVTMLDEIATSQENKLKVQIKRLLALFEPVVLVVLAVIILLVVLTVFLTILDMNSF